MSRTTVLPSPAVPSRLGRLTETERRVWKAFPLGQLVDLRTGDPELDDPAGADAWPAGRSVRGEVLAALLLGACPAVPGAVAALRLAGARITGELRFDHGTVSSLLFLRDCRFEGAIVLDGAVAESIDLSGSRLVTLSAYGARVRGTFDLRDTVVGGADGVAVHADGIRIDGGLLVNRCVTNGSFDLIHAEIAGQVAFVDAQLRSAGPGGVCLNAGGMRVGRSLLAQRLRTRGELRLPGAQIGSSLLLTGAQLDGDGADALYAPWLSVASETALRLHVADPVRSEHGEDADRPFTARGTVQLISARLRGGLDCSGAQLTATAGRPALEADRMVVEGSLLLTAGFHTEGEIRLTAATVSGHLDIRGLDSPKAVLMLQAASAAGGIHDRIDCWPEQLRLDGFTYGPFIEYRDAKERIPLLRRQARTADPGRLGAFRAQPYEQLASYYRSIGNDGEARTVMLARQRALRAVLLPRWRRVPGAALDLLVGYGYRPLRAIGWAVALLVASSAYFSQVRPVDVSREDTSVFNPVLYAADHLVPVIHFGESDVWQYHGVAAVVTVVLTVLGWTLGIAIAAAATRTLTRN